ncbi:MAG: hypothetical protein ACE5HM_04150 [Acidiferrobacterales bacterium]
MTLDRSPPISTLRDEAAVRWGFLEDETDACAVVSERMELVYLNTLARILTPPQWFAKRCFEVLPTTDEQCAWQCPTIAAVHQAEDITYCEESLHGDDASVVILGTAVIPVARVREDESRALLLFRHKDESCDEAEFRKELLEDASRLQARVTSHFV